jgi:hypothetical protein
MPVHHLRLITRHALAPRVVSRRLEEPMMRWRRGGTPGVLRGRAQRVPPILSQVVLLSGAAIAAV